MFDLASALSSLLCVCVCMQLTVRRLCGVCSTGTCADCVVASSGFEVYGRFARDFDYDLFRAAAGKASPGEAHASLPKRPHCDAGGFGPVVIDVVPGERAALFPGGITQRAAPNLASVISKLAASASGPAEVAASALRTQALQTGMVCDHSLLRCGPVRVAVAVALPALTFRAWCRLWLLLLHMWFAPCWMLVTFWPMLAVALCGRAIARGATTYPSPCWVKHALALRSDGFRAPFFLLLVRARPFSRRRFAFACLHLAGS